MFLGAIHYISNLISFVRCRPVWSKISLKKMYFTELYGRSLLMVRQLSGNVAPVTYRLSRSKVSKKDLKIELHTDCKHPSHFLCAEHIG